MNTESDPEHSKLLGEDDKDSNPKSGDELSQSSKKISLKNSAPSSLEIGTKANKRGDFSLARQMFHSAIDELEKQSNKPGQCEQILELMTSIADTYLNEADYEQAKRLYEKTAKRCQSEQGANTFHFACLMLRLAEVSVLQSEMDDFTKYFNRAQQAYLLSQELDTSIALNALVDLSWVLCAQGYTSEVIPINNLIMQIKQIEKKTNTPVLLNSKTNISSNYQQ